MATAAILLRSARKRAGLTQRALAASTGMPQASISRIESGTISPRTDTLQRLLGVCGMTLESRLIPGSDVDRSAIRRRLSMAPSQRSRLGVQEARAILALRRGSLRRSGW